MKLFEKLVNYDAYLNENPFYKDLKVDLNNYGKLDKKIERNKQYSVNPE